MKIVFLILCIWVGGASLACADDLAMAQPLPVIKQVIQGGLIKSVSWADPSKGTRSEIVVLDGTKKSVHILITSTTTLWDSDAKAIMPDKILARGHANVIYLTTVEGVNVAMSIKILK